jgi:hypothetical protein
VCTRGSDRTLLRGPSTSPLDAVRTLAAFFIAAMTVAALAPLAIEGSLQPYPLEIFLWTFPFVCVFSALVAFPTYLVLLSRNQVRMIPLMLGGSLAALVSFCLFHGPYAHATFEQIGDIVYVSGGSLTPAGWHRWIQQAVWMSIAGAIGGLVFWAVRRLTIVGGVRDTR